MSIGNLGTSLAGLYDSQIPPFPRKVGTPLSSEIPAPVRATTLFVWQRSWTTCSNSSIALFGWSRAMGTERQW